MPTIPLAPTGLTGTLQAGPQVLLSWTDNATNETGFQIYRRLSTGAYALLTTVAAHTGTGLTTYTDTTVAFGNTYLYEVRAINLVGTSAYSNIVTVLVVAPPAAPTGLSATLQTGPQVLLRWTDNATNETGFQIYRRTSTGAWTLLTTAPAFTGTGIVTYTDTSVVTGNTYLYEVRAVNAGGTSTYSNIVSIAV